jgi:hypothetical protein
VRHRTGDERAVCAMSELEVVPVDPKGYAPSDMAWSLDGLAVNLESVPVEHGLDPEVCVEREVARVVRSRIYAFAMLERTPHEFIRDQRRVDH